MTLLVIFCSFPEGFALCAHMSVFFICIFNSPEAFVLLCGLEKQIVYVVIEYMFIIIEFNNIIITNYTKNLSTVVTCVFENLFVLQ